ncbi:hypothetical protein WN51_06549 [Melipona quadrifasciata]|uniref:Uncharacterized protein n=1 Tax=Melipona quadrifasciata TaxID=166423 RepID=A0A0M8ZR72_9HYME|nr:hypothetical protein WN51_06549 [Melipona quadrifasciata]
MERGGNFGFIDIESFVFIREDIIVERGMYGMHVWYAPVTSLRAEWKIGFIIFLVKLLAEFKR